MRRYLPVMFALLVVAVGCAKDETTSKSDSGKKGSAPAKTYDTSTPAKLYTALHESFNAADAEGIIALLSEGMQGMMLEDMGKMKKSPERVAAFRQRLKIDKDPLSLTPEELLVLKMQRAFTMPDRTAAFIYETGDKYIGTAAVDGGTLILAEGPKYRRGKKDSAIKRRRVELAVVKEAGGWRLDEDEKNKLRSKPDRTFETKTIPHMSLTFSADGKLLGQCTDLGLCKIWNAKTGEPVRRQEFYAGRAALPAVFNSDLSLAAIAIVDRELNIWETTTGKRVSRMGSPEELFHPLAFSPDGKLLATTSSKTEGMVVIWSTETWREAHRLHAHRERIAAVAFSPDGNRLATAGADKLIKIWDRPSWTRLFSIATGTQLASLTFSPDGKRLASVAADWGDKTGQHEIVLWGAAGGKRLHRITGYAPVTRMVFVPNSERLVAFGSQLAALIDLAGGMELRQIEIWRSWGYFGDESVACSSDGAYIAAAGEAPKDDRGGGDGPGETTEKPEPADERVKTAATAPSEYTPRPPEEEKEPAPIDSATLGRTLVEQDDRPKDGLILIWKVERPMAD